jgi:hypothetical protein
MSLFTKTSMAAARGIVKRPDQGIINVGTRVENLVKRLRRGADKSLKILRGLHSTQWQMTLYEEPYPWTVRDMLAHLLWSEEGLRRIAQNIAAGGPGAPESLDYDAYNAEAHARSASMPPEKLLASLKDAREATIAWVQALDEAVLDLEGHHPALGEITLETLINAVHGHQMTHLRDLQALLRA